MTAVVVVVTGALVAGCANAIGGTAAPALIREPYRGQAGTGVCRLFPAQQLAEIYYAPTVSGTALAQRRYNNAVLDECQYKDEKDSIRPDFQFFALFPGVSARTFIAQGTATAKAQEPVAGVGDFGFVWHPSNTKHKLWSLAAGRTVGDHDVVINLTAPDVVGAKGKLIAMAADAIMQTP